MTATTSSSTTTASQPIPQNNAVASTSAASTPSASPQQSTNMASAAGTGAVQLEDRLNALLSSFDIGTHGLCREERRTGEWTKPQSKPAAPRDLSPSRSPLLSLLSLTRPRMSVSGASSVPTTPGLEGLSTNPFNNAPAGRPRPQLEAQRRHSHFDPGREPKLHGLF